MSNNQVPRLQTYHFTIPDLEALVFEENKHRTYFAVQDRETTSVFIWIGLNPPADTAEWLSIGGPMDQTNTATLENGVFGPIYIAEGGGSTGEITVVSALLEIPTSVIVANL